jgi:hypothetical protein
MKRIAKHIVGADSLCFMHILLRQSVRPRLPFKLHDTRQIPGFFRCSIKLYVSVSLDTYCQLSSYFANITRTAFTGNDVHTLLHIENRCSL